MYRGLTRNVVQVIIFSIITCGIYGIYWEYTVGKEMNEALGYEAVKPWLAIVGILCFPLFIYYTYTLDKALLELAPKRGIKYESNFVLWLVTIIIGIGIIIEMIQVQTTLNEIWGASDRQTVDMRHDSYDPNDDRRN